MDAIGDDVRLFLRRFGRAEGMDELVRAWPHVVGPPIADNAWPARVARDGTLHVATRSSTWAFELTQLEAGIRERLAQALGDAAPRRLRFAPGRLPERGREPEQPALQAPAEPIKRDYDEAAAIASRIGDEELRSLVVRAIAMSLASAGSGRQL